MYTASTAFLEALIEAGVDYVFANIGSDHPALVEAIALARQEGRKIPQIVTTPHEFVGLCAAHGHALVSGQGQAVVVHVECGTQNLGGAIHNAAKGRVPVLIFAGASPYTQEGELLGGRNEFIQWTQDVFDQRGIVRGYMRYDNEIRTGRNLKQLVHRAMQFAHSDPKGPVYLMGAREPMEEEVPRVEINPDHWRPMEPAALSPAAAERIAKALSGAKRPLIVTSYIGRKPEAVAELVKLAGRLGVGVLESVPSAMNFPHDNPMFVGVHWNHPFQQPQLAEADVVLVIDSDIPWIPLHNRPAASARVFHIDLDVLKETTPLHYLPAERLHKACSAVALSQINAALDRLPDDLHAVDLRRGHFLAVHVARGAELVRLEQKPEAGPITIEYLMAALRAQLDDSAIVMNEGITNYHLIYNHLGMTRPGSMFTSGAGSLGWSGGAAIGAKLAAPEATVVSITGDGCYMFSIPATVHWMARQYDAPFLQIVLNNRGWKAPMMSLLGVHPNGVASRANSIDNTFDPPADYGAIATAAGAGYARKVTRPEEVEAAIAEGLRVVREERRAAVLDVWLAHL
jgi:acetolactate synthase-1/2/3 large subunit